MLTLHEALGDKFTTMLEVRRVGGTSRMQKIMDRWTAGPSFRVGKQANLRGLGRGFGANCLESRDLPMKAWYHPFLGATCYIGFESGGL